MLKLSLYKGVKKKDYIVKNNQLKNFLGGGVGWGESRFLCGSYKKTFFNLHIVIRFDILLKLNIY